ncbi:MAG: class I SAM-dependent rRNA methyltransferase [Bacteroidota bacterium]|nr:class I SAM-dependent rRNA methyltransferase [Bacteroidota bacterium]
MYPSLILKSGREKPVLNFHPWVFSGGVKLFPKSKNGSIIQICDNKEEVVGFGFYSPNSQLVARVFHFGSKAEKFDELTFWLDKFNRAFDLRKLYVIDANTNAYRLIFAEGDSIPGLVVDIYDQTAVVQVLIKGTENLLPIFKTCLNTLGINNIYVRIKTATHELEDVDQSSYWLDGASKSPLHIMENGIKFEVDVEKGQKTGFFIDQRDNRLLLKTLSEGKNVLNTFSYTGGFSMYALAGGAKKVVSVDISKDAVKRCDEHIQLNKLKAEKHTSIASDVFDYLKTTDEKFDIIILDPPAFAKNAKSVPNATRGYKELNMLGIKKVKHGGLIMTYSCSQNIDAVLFQKIVFGAAADTKRNVRIIKHLHQPVDHPINIFHPEGDYLKGLLLYVE